MIGKPASRRVRAGPRGWTNGAIRRARRALAAAPKPGRRSRHCGTRRNHGRLSHAFPACYPCRNTKPREDIMKRALVFGLLIGAGAALHLSQAFGEAGWTTILDGKSLDGWTKIGDANWRAEDGAVVADKTATKGNSFLVSKNSYGDVMIRAEFWASDDANSGVYFRC